MRNVPPDYRVGAGAADCLERAADEHGLVFHLPAHDSHSLQFKKLNYPTSCMCAIDQTVVYVKKHGLFMMGEVC